MKNLFIGRYTASIALIALLITLIPKTTFAKNLTFAGRNWEIKNGYFGPGPNYWSDDAKDVFTDNQGRLHMKVTLKKEVGWYATEVYLPFSLGYGRYEFEFDSRVDTIDKNLVAAPFIYQDDSHEIDIEFSRWRSSDSPNQLFTVQPSGTDSSIPRNLLLQNGTSRYVIDWQPTMIGFESWQNGILLNNWTYAGYKNFTPGKERVHINFWMVSGAPPSNQQESEIVVRNFQFAPWNTAATSQSGVLLPQAKTSVSTPAQSPSVQSSAQTIMQPIIPQQTFLQYGNNSITPWGLWGFAKPFDASSEWQTGIFGKKAAKASWTQTKKYEDFWSESVLRLFCPKMRC